MKRAVEDLYGAELDEDLDLSDISDPEDLLQRPVRQPISIRIDEDEDEEEDEEEDEDLLLAQQHEEAISVRVKASQDSMRNILSTFTPEQMHRYEAFRRNGFKRDSVKKLMQKVYGHSGGINPNCSIVVSGVAKVFTGELVELAKALMERAGEPDDAPITPFYILEAHRRLQAIDPLASNSNVQKSQKTLFF